MRLFPTEIQFQKQAECGKSSTKVYIMWHIDPLLGKDLEINNEATAVVMQRRGRHAATTIALLLETALSA
jgi:hypothetical protein